MSASWTISDLEKVAKSLKNNQSRDPHGMINELFKKDVAGIGLKQGVIGLMNTVKTSFFMPEYMEYSDISSIFKNKGSRQDLKNDRGIFILAVLKKY